MDFSKDLSKFEVGSKEYIFFEKVFEKLGPNFLRKSTEENLRKTHNDLNKAIQNYFQMHILANAVIRSTEQLETSQEDASSLKRIKRPFSNNVHPLYLNYVRKYLPSEEMSQELKLFGLSQENTLKATKSKNSEAEATAFKKLVEENIKDFCIKLVQCTGDSVYSAGDWKSALHRTIKNLESKAILLSSEETKEHSKKQLREMIETYYEELNKGVMLLSKLLSLHEQKLKFECNLSEFYLLRCHAIFLKIKVFELKILESTYNQETIPVLKQISDQLDESEQKLKEQQNEKTVALEQYSKLGEEYENCVDEYAHLIKSIKEQQWAIDALKSGKSQYGVSSPN